MILLLIPALIFLFLARGRWIAYQVDKHALLVEWYCWRTKQPLSVMVEMKQCWPGSFMLLELWHWGWRRYVIDHERYNAMMAFIAAELQRNDLDWNVLQDQPPTDN